MAKRLGKSPMGDSNAYNFEKMLLAERLAQGRLVVAANLLLRAIRNKLNQAGTGRWYRSRTGTGMHQASAPGEPPAPDTHRMRRSARVKDLGIGRGVLVSVTSPGAATLEFGDRAGTLLPRPYMRPSVDESKERMAAVLVRAIQITTRPIWFSF